MVLVGSTRTKQELTPHISPMEREWRALTLDLKEEGRDEFQDLDNLVSRTSYFTKLI